MLQSILHFPIWQGAGARHGYVRGAGVLRKIAADYRPVRDVAMNDDDFSPPREGIKGFDTLARLFDAAKLPLADLTTPVMVLGGDCVADFIPLATALARHGEKMAVLWVDAHPDVNTPQTSPSGNFHGMLVRTLLGEGPKDFVRLVPHLMKPSQLFYVGVRDADMDAEEFRYIAENHIPRLSVDALEAHRIEPLLEALRQRGFTHVYLHVDSDVMDLTDYPQAVVAVPGGVSAAALIAFLQKVRAHFPLAGAALTEYSLERSAGAQEEALARRLLVDGFGIG